MGARLAGWVAILAFLALCAEVMSFAALKLVPQFRQFTYNVPEVSEAAYRTYLDERDPVLGWPSPDRLSDFADARGARISPANAALGDISPCISVYGDSFAFGDEASDTEAWANVLAETLGCRVDNYGIGGYGTGQALLRFESHLAEGKELGDVIVLTMYPDNLNRNVNQWRYLLTRQPLWFKPAFYVTPSGDVALAPLFDGDYATFQALTQDPASYLPGETYLPGAPGFRRPVPEGFPYAVTLGRILTDQVRNFRGFEDRANFYNYPTHFDSAAGPSENKRKVATHIIRRYRAVCADHDKTCVFVITPDPEMILQRSKPGTSALTDWIAPATDGLIFLNGAEIFSDVEDICTHLTRPEACSGHYSAAGYARLADFVKNGLADVLDVGQ